MADNYQVTESVMLAKGFEPLAATARRFGITESALVSRRKRGRFQASDSVKCDGKVYFRSDVEIPEPLPFGPLPGFVRKSRAMKPYRDMHAGTGFERIPFPPEWKPCGWPAMHGPWSGCGWLGAYKA